MVSTRLSSSVGGSGDGTSSEAVHYVTLSKALRAGINDGPSSSGGGHSSSISSGQTNLVLSACRTRQSSNVGGAGDSCSTDAGHCLTLSKALRAGSGGEISENPSSSSAGHSTSSSVGQNHLLLMACSSSSLSHYKSQATADSANLLDLPPEVLEKVFTYLGYHTVAQLRVVCKQLDQVCCNILNSTFQRLQTLMLNRFQSIRAKMPRRESARRHHPLALESDIIETLHMRLTLLQMTFGKHIERKHCCFFAGEILDEVFRILHYIKVTPKLARPYKVTDELFDLSTMAMEYFKEHIEPTLPEISCFGTEFLDFSNSFSTKKNYLMLDSVPSGKDDHVPLALVPPPPDVDSLMDQNVPQSNMVLRKRIRKIKQGMKRYNSQLGVMRRDLRNCKSKIGEQQKLLLEYATRLDENDKKSEETSRKFSTLLQELNKCKTELQFWRSKAPANLPLCQNCGSTIPVATGEDLQALANQGVLEGLLTSPVPMDSGEDLFQRLWEADQTKKEEVSCASGTCSSSPFTGSSPSDVSNSINTTTINTCTTITSSSTSISTVSTSTATSSAPSNSSELQVAPKAASKRKASTDDASSVSNSKLRRTTHMKSRTSKRSNKI